MRSLLRQLIWNCSLDNKDVTTSVWLASLTSLAVIGLMIVIGVTSWNVWVGVAVIGFLVYKLFRYALHKDVEE